jgi:hypothetical protein
MASDLPSRDLDCCLDHAALLKEGRNPPYPSLYVQSRITDGRGGHQEKGRGGFLSDRPI